MSTNLCVESHARNLLEEGFEVGVIADASGSAKLPGLDTFQGALMNLRMIMNHLQRENLKKSLDFC